MDRQDAARLLGVPASAGEAEVERSFRMRARLAHPDHGGDAEAFRELLEARRVLRGPLGRVDGAPRTRLDVVSTPANPVMRVVQALRERLLDAYQRVR